MKTDRLNAAFTAVLLIIFISGTVSLLSQDKNESGNLKEFDGVKIVKPEVGFLKITNNWKWENRDIFEVKYYLPYKIYNSDGILFRNISGSKLDPQIVTLPEGLYYVKTLDSQNKELKFGIEIIAGKFTLIE